VAGIVEIDGSAFGNTSKQAFTRTDASWSINNETDFRIYGNTGDTTSPSTKRMALSTNGDISFYEDTGTTPKFFWDASAESLGIGTSSPQAALNVFGSDGVVLNLANASWKTAQIKPIDEGAAYQGALAFFTHPTAGAPTTPTEAMRIDSSGNVGIGTSSPAARLHVDNGSGSALYVGLANNIYSRGAEHIWQSQNNASEYMRIDSSGNVGIGTSSPDTMLEISGNNNAATENNTLRITDIDGFTQADQNVGRIEFFGSDTSGAGGGVKGALTVKSVGTSGDSYLTLSTASTAANDIERMRIDSSGNVGIGISNPSSYQGNADNLVVGNLVDAGTGLTIVSGTANLGSIHFADSPTGDDSYRGFIQYNHASNYMRFATNATERMRIDSSGNLLVGTTDSTLVGRTDSARLCVDNIDGNDGIQIKGSGIDHLNIASWIPVTGSAYHIGFGSGTSSYTEHGVISTNGSTTTYGTSSDYRLKENVVDLTEATNRLKQLKPKRFNFIGNPDVTVDGFLAHEAQNVVSEAVVGEKDGVNLDGSPKYQHIDQSKLVPLLVATIKELEARITALENA
jgi:hypothetical protein